MAHQAGSSPGCQRRGSDHILPLEVRHRPCDKALVARADPRLWEYGSTLVARADPDPCILKARTPPWRNSFEGVGT